MTKAVVVLVTASSRKEADRIAQTLVEERWAACVSVVPDLYSRYRWEGRIEHAKELLLIIKTSVAKFKGLEKRVRALHSYSVPEILALPVAKAHAKYLQWLLKSV